MRKITLLIGLLLALTLLPSALAEDWEDWDEEEDREMPGYVDGDTLILPEGITALGYYGGDWVYNQETDEWDEVEYPEEEAWFEGAYCFDRYFYEDPDFSAVQWPSTFRYLGGEAFVGYHFRELTLPDGTRLQLGPESRVTWPETFTGAERRIFLEGEVVAEVAKDPEHPFIIQSGDVDVRVHGTTFNFKSYHNDTMVEMMLMEGSVSLDIPSGEGRRMLQLTPGDIAQYNRVDGDVVLGKISSESFLTFSEQRSFSFFNVPLSDIAADLERAFGTKIVVADQRIVSRRFLAFFTNHESLDEILSLLSANGGLRVTRSDGVIYLYSKQ